MKDWGMVMEMWDS